METVLWNPLKGFNTILKKDIRRAFRIFLPTFLYAAFNNFFRQIKPDSGKMTGRYILPEQKPSAKNGPDEPIRNNR